eukprot:5103797-Pleurochrysis_carterae.AAC.1
MVSPARRLRIELLRRARRRSYTKTSATVRRSCDLLAAPSGILGVRSGWGQNDGASTVYCVGCRAGGDVAARSAAASPPCLPSPL